MKWLTNLYLRVEYYIKGYFDLKKEAEAQEAQLIEKVGDRLEVYVKEELNKKSTL